jgi:hypothetical protein
VSSLYALLYHDNIITSLVLLELEYMGYLAVQLFDAGLWSSSWPGTNHHSWHRKRKFETIALP